jgi:hypothetical protein
MKKLLTIVIVLFSITTFARERESDTIRSGNWIFLSNINLSFSQNYFSNWAPGGQNSITAIGGFSGTANYTKGKHSYNNWLNLALGYSIIGDTDPMKSEDRIQYITSYQYELHKHWYLTFFGTFNSQFAKGYDYAKDSSTFISKFMAPGYVDLGPGIMYKPNDWFQVNFSPVTARWIIVSDQNLANMGSFGLTPADTVNGIVQNAKKVKSMFGAKLLLSAKKEVAKNITVGTLLGLFSDYLDNPQNIDVNWQVLVEMKVNKWLSVNLSTQLVYDNNVMITDKDGNTGPRTQFQEAFMLSVGYRF